MQGINRLCIAFIASLAFTLPAFAQGKAKAAPEPAAFDWTGAYAGLTVGYAWGDVSVTDTNGGVPPGPFTYDTNGTVFGGQLGYLKQFGSIVLGAEVEGGHMGLAGSGKIPSSTPPHFQRIDLDGGLYGIASARIGFAVDRWLAYAKGGWSYWDASAGQKTTKAGYVTHRTDAFSGLVYGAGVEHAFTDRMSIRLEWQRFDFGSQMGDQESTGDPPIGFKYLNKHDLTADSIKLGVNFKF